MARSKRTRGLSDEMRECRDEMAWDGGDDNTVFQGYECTVPLFPVCAGSTPQLAHFMHTAHLVRISGLGFRVSGLGFRV